MLFAKSLSPFTLIMVALQTASAAPAPQDAAVNVPEVIPGPGLPSLESLGLTSEQLYAMGLPAKDENEVSAMFNPECGPSESAYANVNGAIACFNYLKSLGTTACRTGAHYEIVEMCRSGDAHVAGQGATSSDQSSYCRDVATAVLWVTDHCTRPDQSVAGEYSVPIEDT